MSTQVHRLKDDGEDSSSIESDMRVLPIFLPILGRLTRYSTP